MKQLELAGMMGISSESLGRKLKGRTGWSLAEIMDAASALGTSVAYLVGEAENPQPAGPTGGLTGSYTPSDLNREPIGLRLVSTEPIEVPAPAEDEQDAIVTELRPNTGDSENDAA